MIKKRDQVIGFYTGAIGLYLSFGQESFKEFMLFLRQNQFRACMAVIVFLLVNIVTMQLLLRYRSFHMHCNLGAQVLQRFLANNLSTEADEQSKLKEVSAFQIQKQFNQYFLSIYRYPFSRKKPLFSFLYLPMKIVAEDEKLKAEIKKAWNRQNSHSEKERCRTV